MSGEGQFLLRGEDAHPHAFALFGCRIAPLDEGCLGKIEFARDCLHAFGGKPDRIEDDREAIAFERSVSEDIHELIVEA